MRHFSSIIIFCAVVLGVVGLFNSDQVFAQTCCVRSAEESEITRNPSGNVVSTNVLSTQESCRAETTQQPCDTVPTVNEDSCRLAVGLRVCRSTRTVETSVVCTSRIELPGCRQAIIDTTSNCADYNGQQANCEANNECFYNAGQCRSVFDVSICQLLPNNACTRSQVCEWVGDRCTSQLEANLSREYEVSEGFSRFIPACAYTGTCNNLEDLLAVVINLTREVLRYIGILAFIFFLIGGATMIASFGNPERFKKGRQMLVAASIGLVISLSAFVLVAFILNAVGVANEFRVF